MGSASFCPICGDIIGGWQLEEIGRCQCDDERDRMTLADVIVEQFDFAIDAAVEVRNYLSNISAYFDDPAVGSFGDVDYARIALASARLVEEFEKGFDFDNEHEAEEGSDEAAPEEAEQVRGDSNGRGRYSVPFEA